MEEQDKAKRKLNKWLNSLQQESWQLELLVSGFAIFLALGAINALDEGNFLQKINGAGLKQLGAALSFGYIILLSACFFILVNLVLHVLLRGLWISTLGLRYVSGDIDFEKLKLAPVFDRFLRRRIGSFDQYILRLENLCSVIFAFTFLIVFMLVGFALFFFLLLALIYLTENIELGFLSDTASKVLGIALILSIFISANLYFIDFVTLGWVKRVRWLSRVYYPVYRFYSVVTLASLYRPIYYNLVDNKFGRRVGFLLMPYVLVMFIIVSYEVKSHIWFPEDPKGVTVLKGFYDDLRPENQRVNRGSIPSKYVKNGYLELFLHYYPALDDRPLKLLCPDFIHHKEIGIGTDFAFSFNGTVVEEYHSPSDSALICMVQLYEIQVADSIFQNPQFHFYKHPNDNEYGLLTMLDVSYLSRGPYALNVRKINVHPVNRDSLVTDELISIPFWIE